jgi:hypothetical protein
MDVTQSARRYAFSTLVATLVAPNEAFETLREQPAWATAMVVTILLAMAGGLLGMPAARHMLEVSMPLQLANDPRVAGLPPDQAQAKIQQMVSFTTTIAGYTWLFSIAYVPVVVVLEASFLFLVKILARAEQSFVHMLALAAHVQFVALGLGSIVLGAIVALRPVESFRTQADLMASTPTPAWVFPSAPAKAIAFFAALGPFQIWATVLLALGLVAIPRLRPPLAWTTAIVLLLFGGLVSAAFVR